MKIALIIVSAVLFLCQIFPKKFGGLKIISYIRQVIKREREFNLKKIRK